MNGMQTARQPLAPRTRHQRGFTLIEVLVTIIVLAIGLLGLAGLQLNSLKYNHSAYQTSQATILANDVLDRMRANITAAGNGAYDIGFGSTPAEVSCTGAAANCDPATMANADLHEWKQAITTVLPDGEGSITRSGTLFTVTIRWDDSRGEEPPKSLSVEAAL